MCCIRRTCGTQQQQCKWLLNPPLLNPEYIISVQQYSNCSVPNCIHVFSTIIAKISIEIASICTIYTFLDFFKHRKLCWVELPSHPASVSIYHTLFCLSFLKPIPVLQFYSFLFPNWFIRISGLCTSSFRISSGNNLCRSFCAPTRFHDANVTVKTSPETLKIISLDTANSAQVVKYNISEAVEKYKAHPTDTGSTSVQGKLLLRKANIAVLIQKFRIHSY